MKLKYYYLGMLYCAINTTSNYANKMQSKANQLHSQIQTLLEDFSTILPQQSTDSSFNINNMELQENKTLSLEEIKNFILKLQVSTQHLEQLNQHFQQQEKIILQHKKVVLQLIKIALWIHQEKTIEAWNEYSKVHMQTCATIQKNLLELEPYTDFDNICRQVGQNIINTISILILQFHDKKELGQQLKFFIQAYIDFIKLFSKYSIKTIPEINSLASLKDTKQNLSNL